MDETRTSKAIILNRRPWRESDSLVSVYTADYGRLNLLARGTKKLKSKLAGHIEPLNLVDLLIIRGKSFDYLGSAVAQDVFANIKADLNKLYFVGRALALFNNLVKENHQDERLFLLLSAWLKSVNDFRAKEADFDKKSGELFYAFFALKLLAELGYAPEIENCLVCKQVIKPGVNYFNFKDGGLVCEICFEKASQKRPDEFVKISDDAVKLLRFITRSRFSQAAKLKLDKKLIKELKAILDNLVAYNF